MPSYIRPKSEGAQLSPKYDWTVDAIAALTRLYHDGLTASQIAAEMSDHRGGPTRNAIIGKIHRLNLNGRGKPRDYHKPIGPKKVKPAGPKINTEAVRRARISASHKRELAGDAPTIVCEPIPDEVLPEGQGVTLLDLTDQICRWPYGDPGHGNFRFCGKGGADFMDRRPYCAGHTRTARGHDTRHMSPEERQRRSASARRAFEARGGQY